MTDRYIRYVITTDASGAITGMKRVETASDTLAGRLQSTGGHLKNLGSGMTSLGHKLTAISLPLIAVGGYSIKMAMDFQTSMTQLRTQAGASAKEVKTLEGSVLKLGPKVAEGPKELAEALYPIRSVGLKGSQAMRALTASAKGAQISGAGLTETAEAMSGALRTNLKDVHSASEAMGIMNGIVGLGKLHLSELTQAMATGILPQAKAVGLGFRGVGAALDAMTRQNVPATTEATRLRLTLTQFTAPTGAAKRALASIGLGQFTLANDLRKPEGLVGALKELHEHLARLPQDEQALKLSEAFGKSRGSANVVGLLNSLPEMAKIQTELAKTGEGQFNQAFGARTQDASYKMQAALAAGKAALVQFGQTLIPIVIPALTKFSKLVIGGIEWLKRLPKPIKDVIVGFTILLAVGGPLLIFFGNLTSAVGTVMSVLGKLGPAVTGAAAEEKGAFAIAGTTLGDAFSVAFRAALPIAALATFLEILSKVRPTHGPFSERKGHGYQHKGYKSLVEVAASAMPWAPGGTIAEAGLTPSEERAQLMKVYRANYPYGVTSPSNSAKYYPQAHPTRHEQPTKIDFHLDGKVFAEALIPQIRNKPELARPFAEAVTKYAQHKSPLARAIP
jgi:TP901 family phage tail tape measure protein